MRLRIIYLVLLLLLSGSRLFAQPVITVRFANPEFDCATNNYTVDVEFLSNTANQQLFLMNVRFLYQDSELEFISFGEFAQGYGAVSPNPPIKSTWPASYSWDYLRFPSPAEYINGAVQRVSTSSVVLSTTIWTKLFNITFHVDNPAAINSSSFCPSLVWDLEENVLQGGLLAGDGVVITLGSNGSTMATENVQQFNWQYDGILGSLPHGFPVATQCIETLCSTAPETTLPICQIVNIGTTNLPVVITGFENIGAFCLTFQYDAQAMTYLGNTPNPVFGGQNGSLTVTDAPISGSLRSLNLAYSGNALTLADGDTLAMIGFDFIQGSTDVSWMTEGTSCQYFDGNNTLLPDEPASAYYFDGSVTLMEAPVTKIDSTVSAVGQYVTFAMKVWNFADIASTTLTIEYDTNVLTFLQAVPHDELISGFTSGGTTPGSLELNWSGSNRTLPDESVLAYLTFIYSGGATPLVWCDNGSSCQYIHGPLNLPLYDAPTCNYYITGNVAPAEFVWTGENSTDWYTPTNWQNNLVPDRFTNVTIDAAAALRSGFPTFDGDFTLGVHCKDLTLAGNASFIVTGDLVISPGHKLEILGSGIIQVGGDWINSGTFMPGTGTIEFSGTENAAVTEGVPPFEYVGAYLRSTNTAGMVPLSGASAGPSGDNAYSDASLGFNFSYLGVSYSQVRINTNGWLSMNQSGNGINAHDNTVLFDTRVPTTAIAPWWDDLTMDANSAVKYKTEGTAPNRIFTAEWNNMLAYSSGSTTRLNFQVKLYETSNEIEFCYGAYINGTHSDLESASIGIKDAVGGQGNFLEATHNSNYIVIAGLRSDSDWPSVNYRFVPPVGSETEVFHKILVTKVNGELSIVKSAHITGLDQ